MRTPVVIGAYDDVVVADLRGAPLVVEGGARAEVAVRAAAAEPPPGASPDLAVSA